MDRSLLAGLASGFLLGILFLGLAASVLISQPAIAAQLAGRTYRGMSPFRTSIFVALGIVLAWALVGLLFGLVYFAIATAFPGGGIGSPNAIYTIVILVLSVLSIVAAFLLRFRYRGTVVATSLGLALIFGWLLPWLAS